MLNFFRSVLNTRVGKIVTFIVLGVVAVLFGITGVSLGGSKATGDSVAKVGGASIASDELRTRVEGDMRRYQQQYPQLTMADFITQGGFDASYDALVYGAAVQQFAAAQHMSVGNKYVQQFAAGAPAFKGIDGKFSQQAFDQFLQQQGMTYAQFAQNVAQDALGKQLTFPVTQAPFVGDKFTLPYASSLLEKRDGQVALIPAKAMTTGPAPTDADIAQFYQRNVARYAVPERRAIRYALISPDSLKAQATPSDAEVAATYQKQAFKYAAVQQRTLSQVVVADQNAATALAAKVKGGTAIDAAAKAIGLEAAVIKDTDKAAYAGEASADAANAVFGAAKGATVGPIKAPLGYLVVHVDTVTDVAAKSLEQARPDIVATLTKQRTMAALVKLHDALDDAINSKATFDELVAAHKLSAQTTAPLIAGGTNPDDPASKPDPKMTPIVAGAFAVDPAEGPQMVSIGQDGTFALVAIDHVVAAAPRPLAQIRDKVAADVIADRAEQAARKVAGNVVAAIAKGMPLAQALSATKLTLKPIQPFSASRAQLMTAQNPPPPLVLLFNMGEHTAKVIEAPDRSGFIILYLAKVTPGNAAGNTKVIAGTRTDLTRQQGREYVEEFSKAVRGTVGYSRNEAAIAKVKAALVGQGGSDQN
ncbi:MAG: SurA N-terminal domain-containing protein [Pseudomonadota bacterium]|nr:SurA N-terminal domain-containing protein [Pseudomonadota bacterium]